MDAELRERAAFYLTGQRGAEHDAAEERDMRPALFAGYRDLTALRYDFPIVLLKKDSPDGQIAEPLSVLIDRALDEAAVPGDDGERLRIHALKLERELRSMAARGSSVPVGAARSGRAAPGTGDRCRPARRQRAPLAACLTVEGDLIDCDAAMPERLLVHTWHAVQQRKRRPSVRTSTA